MAHRDDCANGLEDPNSEDCIADHMTPPLARKIRGGQWFWGKAGEAMFGSLPQKKDSEVERAVSRWIFRPHQRKTEKKQQQQIS